MSSGGSNVAGAALGTAFSLLLCASIIQGLQRHVVKTTEAVVGQNITLNCTLDSLSDDTKIVNVEWRKKNKDDTKLAVFSQDFGFHLPWPNVSVRVENGSNSLRSYLTLPEVKKWDGGTYICDIVTFPLGSIRRETELKIKDATTVSLQSYTTTPVPAESSVATSPTTGLLTTGANTTWTTATSTITRDGNTNVVTAGEDVTTLTSPTHFSVPTSAVAQTEPRHSTTESSPGSAVFTSTQETASEDIFTGPQASSTSGNMTEKYESPGATPKLSVGNNGTVCPSEAGRGHLAVLVVVPVLVLVAVAGFLYRSRIIKQRMDLPPRFKPPPPPVRYTTVRPHDTLPISRCNSVTEHMDTDQLIIVYV